MLYQIEFLAKPIVNFATCHHRSNSGSNQKSNLLQPRLVLMDLKNSAVLICSTVFG